MGRVVVQHDADDGLARVVRIQPFEQRDELHAAVAVFDIGEDVARVRVDAGQDRHGAPANVLVVASNGSRLARHRRQVRCSQTNGLNARLFIDADGVDGIGARIVDGVSAIDRHVPIDQQNLLHLSIKVWVALFQVAADLVRLDLVLVKDAPYRALAGVGQAREPSSLGAVAHKPRQGSDGPQLCCQAMVFGFGARDADHPGLGLIGDLGLVRPVVLVLQSSLHSCGERFVYAAVKSRAVKPKLALKLGDRGPAGVAQQHLGPLNFEGSTVLELTLPTMTCGHCVSVVTNAIKQADPQASVQIDLANHRVRIETAENRETIESAVTEAGYAPG